MNSPFYPLNIKLDLCTHTFEVFDPTDKFPYPDKTYVAFCSEMSVQRGFLAQFPPNAILRVDGVSVGKLIEVFSEKF
jgi:hypothetical protein